MKNNSYSVAVLGAGNIGSAVIERLENLDNEIVEIDLKSVLVSDISKERTFNICTQWR
jgi:Trk K+ transport system NAD-binding subunit